MNANLPVTRPLLVLALIASLWTPSTRTSAASTPTEVVSGFGIDDEATYAQFRTNLFLAETARLDLVVRPRPRIYGALAGWLAFAESNPNATVDQSSEFLDRWDASLAMAIRGDPHLQQNGSLSVAVRYLAFVEPRDALLGTDTKVGKRALELLGVSSGPAFGDEPFTDEPKRNLSIEQASRLDLRFSVAAADVLLLAIEGRLAEGSRIAGGSGETSRVRGLVADYLASERIGAFDAIRPPGHDVWNALLQSWQQSPATLAEAEQRLTVFEGQLLAQLREFAGDATNAMARIDSLAGQSAPLLETYQSNLENPASVSAALDGLTERQEALARRLAEFDFNARIFAAAGAFAQEAPVARSSREFRQIGSAQTQGNDTFEKIATGIEIATSVLGSDSIAGGVASLAGGLAGLFGGPTEEEQILEKLNALQDQLALFREETLVRLEIINGKLDAIFDVLEGGMTAVLSNLDDVSSRLAALNLSVAQHTILLRNFESRLFDLLQEEANIKFEETFEGSVFKGISFAQFDAARVQFLTWTTTRASGSLFAPGPRTGDTLANASDTLPEAFDEQINYLDQYVQWLAGAEFGFSATAGTSSSPPNLRVWAKGADAFGLLMEQHPFFAALKENNDSYRMRIAPVKEPGSKLQVWMQEVVGDTNVMARAFANYRQALADVEGVLYDSSDSVARQIVTGSYGASLPYPPLWEFDRSENFADGFEPLRKIPIRPSYAPSDFSDYPNNGEPNNRTWFGDEDDLCCGSDSLPECTPVNDTSGVFNLAFEFPGARFSKAPRGLGIVSDSIRTLDRLNLISGNPQITAYARLGRYCESDGQKVRGIVIDIEVRARVPSLLDSAGRPLIQHGFPSLGSGATPLRPLGPGATVESDFQMLIEIETPQPSVSDFEMARLLVRLTQDRPDIAYGWFDDPHAHLGQPTGKVTFDRVPGEEGNPDIPGPFTLKLSGVRMEYDELGRRTDLLKQEFLQKFTATSAEGGASAELDAVESALVVLRSLAELGRPRAVQMSSLAQAAFAGTDDNSVALSRASVVKLFPTLAQFDAGNRQLPRLDHHRARIALLERDINFTPGAAASTPEEHFVLQWALANLAAQERDQGRLAVADTFWVRAGETLTIRPEDLLANDAGQFGVARTVVLSDAESPCPNSANITRSANGNLTFRAPSDGAGQSKTFSYVVEGRFDSPERTAVSAPACVVIRIMAPGDQPRIRASRSGNFVELRWPRTSSGLILESAPSLLPPGRWQPVVGVVPETVGDDLRVIITPEDSGRLFRLRQ